MIGRMGRFFSCLVLIIIFCGCSEPRSRAGEDGTATQGDGLHSASNANANATAAAPFTRVLGKTPAEIRSKLNGAWTHLFAGSADKATGQRVYFDAGSAGGYILDVGSDDVRSEGMSYGMMIAVQLNKKQVFDKLWKWSKRYMQHKGAVQTNPRTGYFRWSVGRDGTERDPNPATDGEEYFATALLFAAGRWGTAGNPYLQEARSLLRTMLHKEDDFAQLAMGAGQRDSVTAMFNRTHKLPVFVPYGASATFSDPSYVLPHFYDIWAKCVTNAADKQFWRDAAIAGRSYLRSSAHPVTFLSPDYANFDGTPKAIGDHGNFAFDAWRVAMNVAMDASWTGTNSSAAGVGLTSSTARTHMEGLLHFFVTRPVQPYPNRYELTGSALAPIQHSPGHAAMNAVGASIIADAYAQPFLATLWNQPLPTGPWRYYDGLLHMLALLHLGGSYNAPLPAACGS